jgi:hypothetical protein
VDYKKNLFYNKKELKTTKNCRKAHLSCFCLQVHMTTIKFKLSTALLFTSALLFFNSCRKYEDGPGISFRSADERVSGDWKIEEYTIDGEDQKYWKFSSYLTCTDGYNIFYDEYDIVDNWEWNMTYSGSWTQTETGTYRTINSTLSFDLCDDLYDYDSYTDKTTGTWKLNSDKTKIDISYTGSSGVESYNIIELRENRMKLEGRVDGELVKITFVKQ